MYVYHRWWGVVWPAGWVVFGLVVFALIVFLVLLAVFLLRWAEGKSPKKSQSSEKALEILKERLARGEITEEEYERLKRKIEE